MFIGVKGVMCQKLVDDVGTVGHERDVGEAVGSFGEATDGCEDFIVKSDCPLGKEVVNDILLFVNNG